MNYGVVNKIVKQTYKQKYEQSFHYLIIEQLHLTLHAFVETLPTMWLPRVSSLFSL